MVILTLKLAACWAALSAAGTACRVVVALRSGARIKFVELGWPRIRGFVFRRTIIRIGLIPLSFSVGFSPKEKRGGFPTLLPARRLAILAAPALTWLIICGACLGPIAGLHCFGRGFVQVLPSLSSPSPTGTSSRALVRTLFDLAGNAPLHAILGVLAAKMAAINLLPILPLDGGQILAEMSGRTSAWKGQVRDVVTCLGLLLILGLCLYWMAAIGGFLWAESRTKAARLTPATLVPGVPLVHGGFPLVERLDAST